MGMIASVDNCARFVIQVSHGYRGAINAALESHASVIPHQQHISEGNEDTAETCEHDLLDSPKTQDIIRHHFEEVAQTYEVLDMHWER